MAPDGGNWRPPVHNYCTPGGCDEHVGVCDGFASARETELLDAVVAGLPVDVAAFAGSRYAVVNKSRQALQLYAPCEPGTIIAHIPLTETQAIALGGGRAEHNVGLLE
jgi:hypothetical protein